MDGQRQRDAAPTWTYSEDGAKRFLVALLAVELLLTVAFLFTQIVTPSSGFLLGVFNLGDDQSIPSWFSSTQLAVLGAIFLLACRSRHPLSRVPKGLLIVFSLGAFYLSIDEGAGIHERVTVAMTEADMTWLHFRGNHGGWIAIYAAAAVIAIALTSRWLRLMWSEHRPESVIAVFGIALYVAGGVALEIVGYQTEGVEQVPLDFLLVGAEELLEMAGVSAVLYAALLLALRIASPPDTSPRVR